MKPLRADAARNRERVLAAARQAFADSGVAVPLDEIARLAGVGAGTVYRHFPTKEALFRAVVLDGLERLLADAEDLLTSGDPGQAFFTFFTSMVEQARFNKALSDALALSDAIRHDKTGLQHDFRTTLDRLLSRAQQAGAVRTDVRAVDVIALISGAALGTQRHADDPTVATHVLTVLHDGLRAVGVR